MMLLRLIKCEIVYFTDVRNRFYHFVWFVQPLLYLILLKLINISGHRHIGQHYLLNIAVLTMWTYVLYSSGASLVAEKWAGTIEMILNTPTPLFTILLSKVISNAVIGFGSFLLTIVYGRYIFLFPMNVPVMGLFVIVPTLIVSLIAIGFVLALISALSENAYSLQNLIQYPIPIVCGLFYPLNKFPLIIRLISDFLPVTWSVSGLNYFTQYRRVSVGFTVTAVVVSLLYIAICLYLLKRIEWVYRDRLRLGVTM